MRASEHAHLQNHETSLWRGFGFLLKQPYVEICILFSLVSPEQTKHQARAHPHQCNSKKSSSASVLQSFILQSPCQRLKGNYIPLNCRDLRQSSQKTSKPGKTRKHFLHKIWSTSTKSSESRWYMSWTVIKFCTL